MVTANAITVKITEKRSLRMRSSNTLMRGVSPDLTALSTQVSVWPARLGRRGQAGLRGGYSIGVRGATNYSLAPLRNSETRAGNVCTSIGLEMKPAHPAASASVRGCRVGGAALPATRRGGG